MRKIIMFTAIIKACLIYFNKKKMINNKLNDI